KLRRPETDRCGDRRDSGGDVWTISDESLSGNRGELLSALARVLSDARHRLFHGQFRHTARATSLETAQRSGSVEVNEFSHPNRFRFCRIDSGGNRLLLVKAKAGHKARFEHAVVAKVFGR